MRNAARLSIVIGAAAAWLAGAELGKAGDPDGQAYDRIEKGRYLTTVADCFACHTVPNSGKPYAGSRPIETPFGIITSSNITPDNETGIGAWSDQQFDDAVRKGVRPDGSRLYPAMPFPAYTKMTRDDVLAIRAYLSTVEPVHQPVKAGPGMRYISPKANSGPTTGNLRPGIAALIWCKVPGIARHVTRRNRFSAATRPATICAASTCKAGLRPISPAMSARGWASGVRPTSQAI